MSDILHDYNHEAWHGIHPVRVKQQVSGLGRTYTLFQFTDLHMGELTTEEMAIMSEDRRDYAIHRYYGFAKEGKPASSRFDDFMNTAKDEGADLVLMTGDIIDFPSDANVAALKNGIAQSEIPTLYVVGNHDWSFADDYHTPNAEALHLPKFASLADEGQSQALHWVEYEDLLVVAVDNSLHAVSSKTTEGFLALCQKGKPIVLILHVPLYEETMVPKCKAVWGGQVLMMGGHAYHADDPAVKAFYYAVALDENTPVVAVVAGHLHFDFHSTLPNGVPQYVTDKAYTGGCMTLQLYP